MRFTRFALFITILAVAAGVSAQTPPAQGQGTSTPPDQVVVTVNGDPVYAGEVQMAAQQLAQSMARSGQQVDPQRIAGVAMQQMIDGVLLVQEAKRRKMTVDPSIVEKGLTQAETGAGGAEQLDATLKQEGLTRERLKNLIVDSDLVKQLLDSLGQGIEISDEQVAEFYKSNPDYFKAPEEVKASHILFKVDQAADDETKAAIKAKAEAARQRAVAGEDFAELAKELSEGPSGPKGGDLGYFTKDRMVQPFANAAFALQPGEISDVVETRFGFHVIKVDDRKPAHTVPLDEVKDRIRQGLVQEAQGKKVEALLTDLREKADIVPVGNPGAESADNPT